MSVFFGTDGLRGKIGSSINFDIAYKCGNSLSQLLGVNARVIIGRDTRTTGSYIVCALAAGLMAGGVSVVDAMVLPTAGVSYLTKALGFSCGIVITASHNPSEYNGIKIFSKNGEKLSEEEEEKIERGLMFPRQVSAENIGSYRVDPTLSKKYLNFLLSTSRVSLDGLRVVIDSSNGAGWQVAPLAFKKLGAVVIKTACKPRGEKINSGCGSLFPEVLKKKVKKYGADIGFAFDGDADRVIACTASGNIIDGDMILATLAKCLKRRGQLNKNMVVGTSLTNMGIEADLAAEGIKLIRADVGDKWVAAAMFDHGLSLGGEQSGHIIMSKFLRTGDGILSAIQFCSFFKESGQSLEDFCRVTLFPQTIKSIVVKDKIRVLGSIDLANAIASVQQELAGNGRVLVRASGTEPKIRIMVESQSRPVSNSLCDYIAGVVLKEEGEGEQPCAE